MFSGLFVLLVNHFRILVLHFMKNYDAVWKDCVKLFTYFTYHLFSLSRDLQTTLFAGWKVSPTMNSITLYVFFVKHIEGHQTS